MACSSEDLCVPLEYAAEGEACGTQAERVIACTGGWCIAPDSESDAGLCATWAGPGESCKKVPGFERCAEGLTCDAGVCIWPKPVSLPECD